MHTVVELFKPNGSYCKIFMPEQIVHIRFADIAVKAFFLDHLSHFLPDARNHLTIQDEHLIDQTSTNKPHESSTSWELMHATDSSSWELMEAGAAPKGPAASTSWEVVQ